jgi:2-methylisocitrate lyase-like PEP mutase family enzyme
MSDQAERARRFLDLHRPGDPLLLANAWDTGAARVLESLGFQAIATTSSGHAATLGRLDGGVTREEAIAHSATLVQAVDVPVSADLEDAFADTPDGVAETVALALETGLAGCSVEDFTRREDDPIYPLDVAAARVAAAVKVAHRGPVHFVITARAENLLHGRDDLDDTIARLQAYEEAGADVLFAPGLRTAEQIRRVVESLGRPVNVLARSGAPPVHELAALGVSRISVGGSFAFAGLGALVEAATELRDRGTYAYWQRTMEGINAARQAFGPPS